MNIRHITLTLAATLVMQACATSETGRRDYYLSLPETAYPVERIPLFQPDNFSTIDRNYIVIWARANKPYLVRLRQPCGNPRTARSIGVQARDTAFYAKFDRIIVDGQPCAVESLWSISRNDIDDLRAQSKMLYGEGAPR